MAGKRYYWLKLQVGFFQELIIKQLRTLPEGDSIVLLYLKLLLKAINTEGILYYQHILPTLDEEIALDTGEKSALVKLTISALCQYHAAVFLDDQSLQLLYLEDMVGSESASASRVRNHRANQKLLMYGKDFIGTEEALDVWYALLHDLDYQIISKALQQYMLTNKFKPTVAELREIYTELVSPTISDWSEGWEKVSKAIGHYGMYQEEAAMESFDEVTREVVKRLGFQNICLSENIVADRARFAEIYQAIQRRKRTEVNIGSALPNLCEMVQRRLAELVQKGQKAIELEKDKN